MTVFFIEIPREKAKKSDGESREYDKDKQWDDNLHGVFKINNIIGR